MMSTENKFAQQSSNNQETALQTGTELRTQVATFSTEEPTERVTEVTVARQKDKKVAAGRAAAAAVRQAKQERLLEQLRTAKESLRPSAADTSTNLPDPKEANSNDRNITAVGPHGLLGLVLRAVHSCFFRDCAPRKCHKWQARQGR